MTRQDPKQERDFTLEGEPSSKAPSAEDLPRIDFSSFVLSIASAALYHMGHAPDPSGQPAGEVNLPLAKQTIETLEMIEAKTRGNLEGDESKLLETVLYELRMSFVKLGG